MGGLNGLDGLDGMDRMDSHWMGWMGHLRDLPQPVAEDCGELLVLLRLVGVGDWEPIEVVEGTEQTPKLRSCLEGRGRTHQADEHWRDNLQVHVR